VGLGQGLDGVLRRLQLRLGHENAHRVVLRCLLDGRVDARVPEDLLHLLGLGDVAGDRDLNHAGHDGSIIDASAGSARGGRAPLFTSRGAPRSGNGHSISSKSRGTTLSGKTPRASSASSGPKYLGETWVSASRRTCASRATSAASVAVECSVARARSASSARKLASCTSRSAPCAACPTSGDGAVSPASTTFRPRLRAPSPSAG